MSRTNVLPPKVKSRSTGVKPFLESAKTAFPNMMRRVTQTAKTWTVKEKHSEKLKPYLADPNTPYPMFDDTYPTPISLEMPNWPGGEWTDIQYVGQESYRFLCDISCTRIVRDCEDIIICTYGAWTAVADGNIKGWSVFDSKGNNVTSSVTITWHSRAGLSGEIHITPDGGTWADILNDDRETLLLVFRDKGNAAGSYYHPLLQRWIHLVAGKSVCDQKSLVECDVCPPAVVFAFDDASTPDTIAPGGTITLHMTGGKGPFAWSTSSTGYTFGKTSTAFQNNTLISASGVCGVAYDPVADVIITDACGDAIAIEIRNTGGQWILIDSRGSYHGPPQFDEECIIGKIKWFDDMCCISPNTCNEGPFVRHCFIQTGCAGGPATEHWKKYEWQC
ncbi:hypothetical protein KAR91_26975 [Candidatus Pacearchaeota archaeon]|nr:hypothetical protein [Candidatus Pacearchaeota archaeon]